MIETDSLFQCQICEQPICNGELTFVHSLCIERERDGMYDVESDDCDLVACSDCCTSSGLEDLIQNGLFALIPECRLTNEKPHKKITAIGNRYDCIFCSQRIPNNSRILTSTFGFERYSNGSIQPEEVNLGLVSCIDCAETNDLKSRVSAMINNILSSCRRKNLRVL